MYLLQVLCNRLSFAFKSVLMHCEPDVLTWIARDVPNSLGINFMFS